MLKKIVEKNYKWIIIFLCLIIVIMMLEDIFENEQLKIDVFIYKLVVLNLRNQQLTALMKIVTNLASAYVLITIAVASILFIKNKIIGISITSNLVIVTLLNQLLKRIIQRPRPEGYRLITENGYSFPSGHSMVSMAFYGFIIYLIWKLVKNKKIKYLETGILGIFIFLIGFSRIYLGVHYASDVVGGFAISIAYLIMFTNIIKPKLQNKKEITMINKNKFENKKKNKKLINSFRYALCGVKTAWKTEDNLKIHFFIMLMVIIAGVILRINTTEWSIVLILCGLVISLELINTAIENAVDLVTTEYNEKAKNAKDIAAGAVLFSAIIAAIIGFIIFLPKIINII